MPVIRRASTYLDVSTTGHTPEGRLKLNCLPAGRTLPYKNAICTALLFICDENRDLRSADALSMSFEEFQTAMKNNARAADVKLGPCKHAQLRPALLELYMHRHIHLTFMENGKKVVILRIDIQPSFHDMQVYQGFQQVLDGYHGGAFSARNKYRAYMSLATKVFGPNRAPTVLEAARCAVEFAQKYENLARSNLHRGEDEPSAVDADNDPMDSIYQVAPVTPARAPNHNHTGNQQMGLPTPESLPRRNAVVLPPTSQALFSEVGSSDHEDHSHSDRQDPQIPGAHFGYISLAIGFVSGVLEGFRWSCDIFMQEISSLHTRVTDLQTSLTAAEQALRAANMSTSNSQQRCLVILDDLQKARINIADLETRAKGDAVEKANLQQEVTNLNAEVSRLQRGVEQMKQIANGVG
ncbi:hypothetical protein DFH29DRAFT_887885 [Suillus ampliporus]|nr:hypothetical protein DFH29DRAFT_887885 [Suillus ampliporus]